MKVLVVFGTRPEAIKMCPVIKKLKEKSNIICRVCLTGQHAEMLNQVMETFAIRSDYNLHVMTERQTLAGVSARIMTGLQEIYEKEKPDVVLVHGDTTSSYIAAVCAFYQHIPIGHVEAGLRTYQLQSPFPEEFNRQSIDMIADIYFAPTKLAQQQLLNEGKNAAHIYVTGNTAIDALKDTIRESYYSSDLEWCKDSRLILLTAHRRENIGEPMYHMFAAVRKIIENNPDVKVIYPIHKNPQVRKIAEEVFAGCDRIRMVEPLDVLDFHNYMKQSYLILTDSGGIQEEAPALGIPVLVMRDTTERPEGVEAGTLKLVGTDEAYIIKEAEQLLWDKAMYEKMSQAKNPYGDGHASERIVECLLKEFGG